MKIKKINENCFREGFSEYTAYLSKSLNRKLNLKVKFRIYGELNKNNRIALINHPLSYGVNIISLGHEKGWWDKFCRTLFQEEFKNIVFISISFHSVVNSTRKELLISNFSKIQYLILKSLGVSSIDYVIGGSLGGLITADLICTYPKFVKNAVVINAAHKSYTNHFFARQIQEYIIRSSEDSKDEVPLLAKISALMLYKAPQYFDRYYNKISSIKEVISSKGIKLSKQNWLAIKYMLDRYNLSKNLKKIECNVILVGCASDNYYPPYQQMEFHQLLTKLNKKSKLIIVKSKNGHDAFLSDQTLFANQILRNSIL